MNESQFEAFRDGLGLLSAFQKQYTVQEFAKKRATIPKVVAQFVSEAGLKTDPRRRYFELLATSALYGREQLYYDWKGDKNGNKKKTSKFQKVTLDAEKVKQVKSVLRRADRRFDRNREESGGEDERTRLRHRAAASRRNWA